MRLLCTHLLGRLLLAAMATAVLSPTAAAELAVFTDGRVLRVEDAWLEGSEIVLDLGEGALIRVAAGRIDRVVADEVERNGPPLDVERSCPWHFADEPLPERLPFHDEIVRAARAADLHPWLVAAVVEAESAFNPNAVSRVGASGLMQLMPAAASDEGVRDPFDPVANLGGGSRHLRRLLDRFDSLPLGLAAYNAGAATVERHGGVPPYRETRDYVRKVMAKFCPESTE